MGGIVSVTVRRKGEEFRMQRWTNSLPWFALNDRLYEGGEDHLNDYLEQWLLMKGDYEKNKDTGKFEYNMTDAYFPSSGLCPDGYGLVVVDYDTKTILSMQDYCYFNDINTAGILLDKDNTSEESRYAIFKRLVEKGYIDSVHNSKGDTDVSSMNFTDIEAKYLGDITDSYYFTIKSDWNVLYFQPDADGVKQFKAKVEELGFELSDTEEGYWQESIKDAQECY